MKRVHHWVATVPFPSIAGRQKDENGTVDSVPFEVAFERLAVNRDALDRRRPRPGTTSGTVVLTWPIPALDANTMMKAIVVTRCAVMISPKLSCGSTARLLNRLYDVPREYKTWTRWIKRLLTGADRRRGVANDR